MFGISNTEPISGGKMSTGRYFDPESHQELHYSLDAKIERQIRHGFLRKVYGIVLIQLVSTFSLVFILSSSSHAVSWVQQNGMGISIICAIGALITSCYLTFKEDAAQIYPTNYILLGLFTLFESVTVSFLCIFYEQIVVIQALLATTLIVLGLTIFAFQTKYDFTSCMGALFFILLGFIIFGILIMIFPRIRILNILYASVGALIFSVYIVVHTQFLVGRGMIRMESDNYILAAMMIYMDVVNLFLYILRLIDLTRRD